MAETTNKAELTGGTSAPKASGYNLFATALSGVVAGIALIVLAYLIGPDRNVYPVTYVICISGYILGWMVALISTPMNRNDESGISRFTKMAGTFLSGYLLSKLDKIFEWLFNPSQVFTPLIGVRILLFICCFGLTFIMVFYYRRYKWSVNSDV
jgi:hypothetical protein